jgi:hypothetical protein
MQQDITITFGGKKHYAFQKSREYAKRGYVIIRSKQWSDGTYTFTMCKRANNG